LYPSILPVYAAKCPGPKPPKGVGFTDPLSGTLKSVLMDIDLADLPDNVETLQRMVRSLASERASLTEAQAEIERLHLKKLQRS
jgi:hypothetical protein